jgi:hypothetical protein
MPDVPLGGGLMGDGFTDKDSQQMMLRALRLLGVITAIAVPVVWWKLGWQTAALLFVGAAISGSGLWEWLRLMTALMERMEGSGPEAPTPRPMAGVLAGFFLRLGVALAVLYVSLKFLDGSVIALAAGLGLGIVSLTFEALRLVKAWTV